MIAASQPRLTPQDFKACAQYLADLNIARDRLADAYKTLAAIGGNEPSGACENPREPRQVAVALRSAHEQAVEAAAVLARCATFASQIGGAS